MRFTKIFSAIIFDRCKRQKKNKTIIFLKKTEMNENLTKICRICTNYVENEPISLFQNDEQCNIQICEKLSLVSTLKVRNLNFLKKNIFL